MTSQKIIDSYDFYETNNYISPFFNNYINNLIIKKYNSNEQSIQNNDNIILLQLKVQFASP